MTFPKRKNGEIARMRALCVYMRKTRGAARVFCVARRTFFSFYSNPSRRGSIILSCFTRAPNLSLPQKGSKKERSRSLPKRPKKTSHRGKNFCGDAHTLAPKKNFCVRASFTRACVSFVICPSACLPLFRAFEHTKRTQNAHTE